MFLSKHKVQSIQNTQQTVMRSAIPLQLLQNHTECRSSVFIFLKSKTYQINVLSHLRYQNAVIQTRLLAPTPGGTRKLKTGHMEFSPVSAGKTRLHKLTFRTSTKNPSWPENCFCCGEDHGITIVLRRRSWHDIPPHDFREQHSQPRFCPNIGENTTTIVEAGCETRTNSRIGRMRPPRWINMCHTTPKSKKSRN